MDEPRPEPTTWPRLVASVAAFPARIHELLRDAGEESASAANAPDPTLKELLGRKAGADRALVLPAVERAAAGGEADPELFSGPFADEAYGVRDLAEHFIRLKHLRAAVVSAAGAVGRPAEPVLRLLWDDDADFVDRLTAVYHRVRR